MSQASPAQGAQGNDWPAGHQGHLNASQAAALDEFKSQCRTAGCYTPPSDNDPASHDDATLLRFLRARKFVPADALQQFQKAEEWRKEQDADSWYDTIELDDFEAARVLYTHWCGRRDKRGMPLYVFKIGSIDANKMLKDEALDKANQPAGKTPAKTRRLFAISDHLWKFVIPLCTAMPDRPHPEVPVSQTCCIVDLAGVGFRQFYNLKNHLQEGSAVATAHFPESLSRTFVVGAPGFFATVWSWVQYWFDPVTRDKIRILAPTEVKTTLEQFIEPGDIPRAYGGELDWDFGQLPYVDPKILELLEMRNGATRIPNGPIRWQKSDDGTTMEAHAVGTLEGKRRDDVFATVPIDIFIK